MTDKPIQNLQGRIQQLELENRRLHEALVQSERLDQKYMASLATIKNAKKKLQASETLMKRILDSAIDCIVNMDSEGRIIEFNRAASKMFGYARDDVLGRELAEVIIPPALRKRHQQGFQRWLEGHGGDWLNRRVETTGMHASGREFPVELSITEVRLNDSLLFSGFIRDITERRRGEESLKRNLLDAEEARRAMLFMLEDLNRSGEQLEQAKLEWEQTFDAVTDPIFLHDRDGNIVRANQTYAGHARMCFEEIVGKPYWQVFPKRGGPLPGCLKTGEKEEAEEEIYTENGEIFLSHSYAVHGEGDSPCFVHFLENVTGRKHNEQLIRDSEERFRSVSETAQDAIIMLDNRGKISLWNPAAEHIFGYSRHEVMGRELSRFIIPKSSREKHRQGFASFRETGQGEIIGKTVEVTALNRDGSEFPIELSISATKVRNMWYAVAIIRDITERKQAADRLQRSLEGTIQVIVSAVEARDPYTSGHQRRVAKLACVIAKEMRLDANRIEGVHWGAMIHDIGKIQLPAEILSKPTKLTKLEYNLIKEHVQVGYDILKDIEFPWPVADIVHQHHERMDGSGYPQGLDDGRICLEARIVAVSDVVEAMSSHRPYRPGLGIDKALAEIKRGRGKQYDPQAVDACFKLFNEDNFSF